MKCSNYNITNIVNIKSQLNMSATVIVSFSISRIFAFTFIENRHLGTYSFPKVKYNIFVWGTWIYKLNFCFGNGISWKKITTYVAHLSTFVQHIMLKGIRYFCCRQLYN